MLLEWYRDNADGSAEGIDLTKVTNVASGRQATWWGWKIIIFQRWSYAKKLVWLIEIWSPTEEIRGDLTKDVHLLWIQWQSVDRAGIKLKKNNIKKRQIHLCWLKTFLRDVVKKRECLRPENLQQTWWTCLNLNL